MRSARTAVVIACVVGVGLTVWALSARASTMRPDNDPLDLAIGPPDPERSTIEGHLAWGLDALNGAEVTEADVAARLSDAMLAAIPADLFVAETQRLSAAGPYRLWGIEIGEEGAIAVALITDRAGQAYAYTATTIEPDGGAVEGLIVSPVDISRGPLPAVDLAIIIGSGLLTLLSAAVIHLTGDRGPTITVAVAGVATLASLLEFSDLSPAYTVGLVAGPVAAGIAGSAVVDAGKRATTLLVVAAALVAALPVMVFDTAALSLPDNMLFVSDDPGRIVDMARVAAVIGLIVVAAVLAVVLFRQFRADWQRDRGLVATTLGALGGGLLMATPAVSLLARTMSDFHLDLSVSPTVPAGVAVAAVGLAASALWSRYDLTPANEELVAENTELHAELEKQLVETRASRGRLVTAAEQARRQVERDLHDGAQQRLVATRLRVEMERRSVGTDHPEFDTILSMVSAELGATIDELRELSQGLHPAALDAGIVAAAHAMAESSAVPVNVTSTVEGRCPDPDVERTAYFVISEALTNAAKHADASHVDVTISFDGGALGVVIADDGVGGARLSDGHGLLNLQDRVLAAGGEWSLVSNSDGTRIEAVIPCG